MHRFDAAGFGLPTAPHVQLELPSAEATRALGARVGELMRSGGFIGLVGDLGAGKTTFVQGLVGALGAVAVSSPTYTLLNEYEVVPAVYHFDLYRLESADELETVAYWDYAEDPSAIVVVEWIDQVPTAWFGRGIVLELTHDSGARRAALWTTNDHERWRNGLLAPTI